MTLQDEYDDPKRVAYFCGALAVTALLVLTFWAWRKTRNDSAIARDTGRIADALEILAQPKAAEGTLWTYKNNCGATHGN